MVSYSSINQKYCYQYFNLNTSNMWNLCNLVYWCPYFFVVNYKKHHQNLISNNNLEIFCFHIYGILLFIYWKPNLHSFSARLSIVKFFHYTYECKTFGYLRSFSLRFLVFLLVLPHPTIHDKILHIPSFASEVLFLIQY